MGSYSQVSRQPVCVRVRGAVSACVVAVLVLTLPLLAIAQQKVETPEETNARIRALASATQAPSGADYTIGGGDLLKVDVFDVPDLSREVRVSDSGYISLPLIPVRIRAGGLTPFQLEEKIAELLQVNGLVTHPQVSIFVKEQRSQPITVIGAVRQPKVFQAVRTVTLLEVLSEAGGIADDAGTSVIVTRGPGSRSEPAPANGEAPPAEAPPASVTVQLRDLLESGDARHNIAVYGGDVVTVPRAGIVYVVGAVERPGGYVLANEGEDMTTLKALALAQGLKGGAKPNEAVIIRKNLTTGEKQEIDVNLSRVMARKAEDTQLQANDILFIPDSLGKKALKRIGDVALGITSGLIILRGGR